MNVYAETNFILEIVRQQEQHASCEQIVAFCGSGQARLVIPAYCFVEPYENMDRRAKDRKELQRKLKDELNQLARTRPYNLRISSIHDIDSLLIQTNEEEQQRFRYICGQLLTIVEIIPLTLDVITLAATSEVQYGLSPQDAIVYASVMAHLRQSASSANCFLNANRKDFNNPDIVDEFNKHNCKIIWTFDQGYQYIRARS